MIAEMKRISFESAEPQPPLRHGRLRIARQQAADPPAGRDARPDVQALGRDPGNARSSSNLREGLNVLQYFISTHGARKGLADTALKTANSGYLTRKLVDVAQEVIVEQHDCGTLKGVNVAAIVENGEIVEPFIDRVVGRTSLERHRPPRHRTRSSSTTTRRSPRRIAQELQNVGIEKIKIRSILTCEAKRGVCQLCYGRNMASGYLVELGEAVGIVAAQSIGEPGTQLTMRTFHVGGIAMGEKEQSKLEAKNDGVIRFNNVKAVDGQDKSLDRRQPDGQHRRHGLPRPRGRALPGPLRGQDPAARTARRSRPARSSPNGIRSTPSS